MFFTENIYFFVLATDIYVRQSTNKNNSENEIEKTHKYNLNFNY